MSRDALASLEDARCPHPGGRGSGGEGREPPHLSPHRPSRRGEGAAPHTTRTAPPRARQSPAPVISRRPSGRRPTRSGERVHVIEPGGNGFTTDGRAFEEFPERLQCTGVPASIGRLGKEYDQPGKHVEVAVPSPNIINTEVEQRVLGQLNRIGPLSVVERPEVQPAEATQIGGLNGLAQMQMQASKQRPSAGRQTRFPQATGLRGPASPSRRIRRRPACPGRAGAPGRRGSSASSGCIRASAR